MAEAAAIGKVAEIYSDIRATKNIDFVPNLWRVLATNPDQLELVWTRLKALMHPEAAGRESRLDPLTREIIALAVSATNGCAYCVNSHTTAVLKLGLDHEALGVIELNENIVEYETGLLEGKFVRVAGPPRRAS